MLLFKKKFLDAIRRGVKTQTIRLWKHRRMRAGQRSYIPGAGYIRIESVEPVELDRLTEEDASRDGFASVRELRDEIERLYPTASADGHHPYRVRFRLLPPEEQKQRKKKAAGSRASQQELFQTRPSDLGRSRAGDEDTSSD